MSNIKYTLSFHYTSQTHTQKVFEYVNILKKNHLSYKDPIINVFKTSYYIIYGSI